LSTASRIWACAACRTDSLASGTRGNGGGTSVRGPRLADDKQTTLAAPSLPRGTCRGLALPGTCLRCHSRSSSTLRRRCLPPPPAARPGTALGAARGAGHATTSRAASGARAPRWSRTTGAAAASCYHRARASRTFKTSRTSRTFKTSRT
jgi:hypothetical protein